MTRAPIAALALLALAASGCVAKSDYLRKEAEAAQYKKDWEDELAKARQVRSEFATLRGEMDGVQQEARGLAEKVQATEANLAAKQGELNALSARYAEQQALVDELSKSKRKLEAAKAELEKKSAEYQQLATSLQGDIEAGRVELSELKGRLTVKMKDKILFASGSATIGKEGLAALLKVADALRGVSGKVIRIEGHTDNVPTTGSAFATNWELSTARALAVVRYFQEKGVDPTRLAAAGYGEFQPIAPNDTPEGRSLNRRIEIVLAAVQ